MTSDQINTPPDLCRKVIGCVQRSTVCTVADFAAGTGKLLRAASARWGEATVCALDIDAGIVRKLRREQPAWIVSRGDFLRRTSRKRCRIFRHVTCGVDLILLNPPFSSRGGSRCQVSVGLEVLSCSRAAAFVISALPFMSNDGEVVAIIPAGSLNSEKDRKAWALVHETFRVSIVGTNGHDAFEGCSARTVVVHIARRNHAEEIRSVDCEQPAPRASKLVLYRGRLQMHLRNATGPAMVPLVHSTCLRNGLVDLSLLRVSNASVKIKGPVLLLVRVGEPKRDKVVFYRGRKTFALSDCVIALKARTRELAMLYERVTRHWLSIVPLYRGTGAKYITVAEIARFLLLHGFAVMTPRNRTLGAPPIDIDAELRKQWEAFIVRSGGDRD
jgi:predicted RNA methylase